MSASKHCLPRGGGDRREIERGTHVAQESADTGSDVSNSRKLVTAVDTNVDAHGAVRNGSIHARFTWTTFSLCSRSRAMAFAARDWPRTSGCGTVTLTVPSCVFVLAE